MDNIQSIKQKLEANLPQLRNRYPIRSIGVFGSYVRGEETKKSDLDILIEFEKPISLIKFVTLEDEFSQIAGIKVDLVMRSALKPKIGQHILQEVQYI